MYSFKFYYIVQGKNMANIVTTSSYPAAIIAQANETLLATPTAKVIHKIPAMMSKMKSRNGSIQRSRRINNFPLATAPINDGQNPPPIQPSFVDIDVKPQLYGYTAVVKSSLIDLDAYGAIALG